MTFILSLLLTAAVGILAGWISGILMKSKGNLLRNLFLGLVGGLFGAFILGIFGISTTGFIGGLIVSILGACALIWIARCLSKT